VEKTCGRRLPRPSSSPGGRASGKPTDVRNYLWLAGLHLKIGRERRVVASVRPCCLGEHGRVRQLDRRDRSHGPTTALALESWRRVGDLTGPHQTFTRGGLGTRVPGLFFVLHFSREKKVLPEAPFQAMIKIRLSQTPYLHVHNASF
jgi:hypothetical protein